mgnify:CR=1 FL=1
MSNARNIASGAKFVDTAGDTMSGGLNVTGGNLGAGTSSPNQTLTVAHPNHGLSLDYVGATLPAAAGLYTSSTAHTQQAYGDLNIKARSDYSGYGIGMYTASSNNTPTMRMKIDSSGRVTLPYQPYFYAGSTYSGTLISSALMPFDTAAVNRGNHYNTSTYLFTAPISGQYLFTVSALNYPSSTTGQLYFSVNNGGFTALVRNNSIVSQQSIAGSAILNLAANDTVGVIGQLYFYASGGHGHFSGILLG